MFCPGCDREVSKLVRHHWYDENGVLHWILICIQCNSSLTSRYGDHRMSDWEKQKKGLKRCHFRDLPKKMLNAYTEKRRRATSAGRRRIYARKKAFVDWMEEDLVLHRILQEDLQERYKYLKYKMKGDEVKALLGTTEKVTKIEAIETILKLEFGDSLPPLDVLRWYDYDKIKGRPREHRQAMSQIDKQCREWMDTHPEDVEKIGEKAGIV